MKTHVWEVLDRKGWFVHSTKPDETVYSAITMMAEFNVGALAVLANGNDLVGMISERDYLRKVVLLGRSSPETRVEEIMSPEVVVVGPDYSITECLAIMTEVRCRHLPVIRDQKLAGLISIGDCARQLSEDQQATVRFFTDFISGKYPG